MNFIKKVIKIIFITIVSVLSLLYLITYTISIVTPRILMIMASEKYISENYKTATVVKRRYEQENAFFIPCGSYYITLNQDGYEFKIELSSMFLESPDLIDYYGADNILDDTTINKMKNYIVNHELFIKNNYDEDMINIYNSNQEEFAYKEKINKDTFEIITINIKKKLNDPNAIFLNEMSYKEKQVFLNDIYNFLKEENLKTQKLELNFINSINDDNTNNKFSIEEQLNKCSDEFIKYEKLIDSNLEFKSIFDSIKNIKINNWIVEDIFIDIRYDDINIFLKKKITEEEDIHDDLKQYFKLLDALLIEKNRYDNIKLILSTDSNNDFYYIYYDR